MTDDGRPTRPDDVHARTEGDDMFTYDEGTGHRKPRRRGFLRRHPVLVAFTVLLALVVASGAGLALYLNGKLGDIDRFSLGKLPDGRRPPAVEGDALNILLAGVDNRDDRSIEEVQAGGWDAGVMRSDTIMLLHVTADRDQAYLVSIPRDSYVRMYDETGLPQEMNKINAAFSLFGPTAYVSTVENLTGMRMDHLAIVDWNGFEDITNALGGVEVQIAETFYDTKQRRTWTAGTHLLQGEEALRYVRTRYSLPGGDFGRIDRQQNVIRSMMRKMLSRGTLTNPFTLTKTLQAVVSNLTVDDEFDTGEIRNLALSLRGLRASDVTFLTAPFGSFGTTSAGASIVRLDQQQADELWDAAAQDDIGAYLAKYGENAGQLPAPGNVN